MKTEGTNSIRKSSVIEATDQVIRQILSKNGISNTSDRKAVSQVSRVYFNGASKNHIEISELHFLAV
jgi:hypothetical protein